MTSKTLLALVLAGGLFAPCAFAQTLNKHGKPFPDIHLPKKAKGRDISTTLGANLHAIADWYGNSDAELENICKRDRSIAVDLKGKLHYVCAGMTAEGATSGWGYSGFIFQAPYPDSQTFLLHSRPGATRVIYLDFNGHTTSGTSWNSAYTGGASIVTPAYDIDGSPGTFSSTELANIQMIWKAVAEDYAPFEVDVTTQDPGVEGLRKTSSSDSYFGIRVCIGGSSSTWYGASAGGVAYLASFNWNTDTPAFVFPPQLSGGNPKFVAEAISHEVGHSFGLHHDGQSNGTEYFQGQGSWAPIMGVGYYKDVVQWSKGEYALANNHEDDLAMIAGYAPFRADVVGNTVSQASALPEGSFSVAGLVESTGDVDVYIFSTLDGNLALGARSTAPSSGNLNLLFSLYDSNGTLITTGGPSAADSGVAINASVTEGAYYLAVNGVGSGDPVSTGFSNYGSIGQYVIEGTIVPGENEEPTAVASHSAPLSGYAALTVAFSSAGSSDPDGSIFAYDWDFGDGTTSSLANPSHTFVSAGAYTATLRVRDNFGKYSAPAAVNVTAVANEAPVANAGNSAPLSGLAPLTVNFSSAGSQDSDGSIVSYSWNFGDGSSPSTAPNPSHVYTGVGTYVATLTVKDDRGMTSTASVAVTTKANQKPVAVASSSAPVSGVMPVTVNFSSAGSYDPDGSIVSYSWSFGDRTTSFLANPSHTYTKVGTFTATLTVKDNRGLVSASTSIRITVTRPPLHVAAMTIATTTTTSGKSAKVSVTVMDQNGVLKSNATVSGVWSGLTSGMSSAKSGKNGVATLSSAVTGGSGTFTFTITGIALSGVPYDPSQNVQSSVSIASP